VRILFVIARFPPAVGGTERQAALLARWLAGSGASVTVVTQAHPGTPAREIDAGVEIVRLAPPAGGKGASLLFCLRLARLLQKRGGEYDFAQAFLASSPALVVGEFARRRGVPAFLKFGASGPQGDVASSRAAWGGSWKLRRLRAGFARYLCPNEEIRREFLSRGYPGERLVILPNGVDTERFRPAEPREREVLRRELGWEGRTVALFAGRFEPHRR
jgi:glycosyltransferase involved in cell wall biosynthesis